MDTDTQRELPPGIDEFLRSDFAEAWANYRTFWDQRTALLRYALTAFAAFSAALPAFAALIGTLEMSWYEHPAFWILLVIGYWALSMLTFFAFTVTKNWSNAMREHQGTAEAIRDYYYTDDDRFARIKNLIDSTHYMHRLPQYFGSTQAVDSILRGMGVLVFVMEVVGVVAGLLLVGSWWMLALAVLPFHTLARFAGLLGAVRQAKSTAAQASGD